MTIATAGFAGAGETVPMELGSIYANKVVRREIPLRNDSAGDLVVLEARSSCPCLKIVTTPGTIAAKSSAPIVVECHVTAPGHRVFELFVHTLAEAERHLTLRWEGMVLAVGAEQDQPSALEAERIFRRVDEVESGMQKQTDTKLIDVRSPEEFNVSHLAGAMNWPLGSIRSVNSLKNRDLVIYGNGSDDRILLREAQLLAATGFREVHVMKGGLRAWIAENHSTTGSGASGVPGALIEPQVFQTLASGEWLVLRVGGGCGTMETGVASALGIQAKPTERDAFLKEVRRRVESQTCEVKILFISCAGEMYEVIEKDLARSLRAPVFYLKGGLMAYHKFLKDRNSAQQSRQMTLSSERAGSRGGTATVISKASGGCGSCP